MDTDHNPGQRRTALACEHCRKRKRKCDGAQPRCSSCVTQSRDCKYEVIQSLGRKRKWDPDYVSSIEEQLAALKAYVRDLEGQLPSQKPLDLNLVQNNSNETEDSDPGGDGIDQTKDEDYRLTSAVDEVGSLMWKMSIGETGDTSFIGPSGNFCFTTSSTVPKIRHERLDQNNASVFISHRYNEDEELKEELLQTFASSINPFHQFLQLPQILLSPDPDPATSLLENAILAAGCRLSSRIDADKIGDFFAMNAERIALSCCRNTPSLVVIQALTIMCWRELSLENDNMAWMYNSMAASISIHLGLHVSALENLYSENEVGQVPAEVSNQRVRTFWQFFLIDRMATSILGRQCTIPWRRVKTLSLKTILDSNTTLAEIAFDHQCQLWLLHDQFMDQIYSFEFLSLDFAQRNKLLMDARERVVLFHQGIDDRLRFNKTLSSGYVACFQMSYQMSLLLIHRPYLRETPETGSYRLALRSMTAAASKMTQLIRAYRKLECFKQAPFYIVHHILTAAIMHLLSATSSEPTLRNQSISRFRVCIEALEALQPTWSRAGKSIKLLQELAARWSVVFALPMRLSNVSAPVPSISAPSSHEGAQQEFDMAADSSNELCLDGEGIWEYTQEPNYNDLWMDPNAFESFSFAGDQLDVFGLDWLFTSQS